MILIIVHTALCLWYYILGTAEINRFVCRNICIKNDERNICALWCVGFNIYLCFWVSKQLCTQKTTWNPDQHVYLSSRSRYDVKKYTENDLHYLPIIRFWYDNILEFIEYYLPWLICFNTYPYELFILCLSWLRSNGNVTMILHKFCIKFVLLQDVY